MGNNKMSPLKHINAADFPEGYKTPAILGTYDGECADSNITNLNGLDITREVWEAVFSSEEYKQALNMGWYIGFLGHPEDPNCMDFEHACIVMTECHIDDNGKVYGKFNLIDTPVGRIVKTFQAAGVRFGISVRGAGDIINNSVDPETFVFRGFDLVAFPAFPESIPTFTAIAASTDADSQAKYKAICATVDKNLEGLNTVESIDIVASQFAAQSEQYKKLQAHKAEILSATEPEDDKLTAEVLSQKLAGMTQLYIEASSALRELQKVESAEKVENHQLQRKLKSIERITSAQQSDLIASFDKITASYETLKASNKKLKSEIEAAQQSNLKYKQSILSVDKKSKEKDSVISKLRLELAETVNAATETNTRSSNLDAINKKLTQRLDTADKLIQEYQDAYASLYANAIGVELSGVQVTASTSVSEIQSLIRGTIVNGRTRITASTEVDSGMDIVDEDDGLNLVTL